MKSFILKFNETNLNYHIELSDDNSKNPSIKNIKINYILNNDQLN